MPRPPLIRHRHKPAPERFFERELAGEEAPSLATMQSLYRSSGEILAREPWQTMNEADLVMVEDPGSNQMCFCSILGAMGEVFAVHVHLGEAGYRGYLKLHSGEVETTGEFLAAQCSLYAEFERLSRVKGLDRAVLQHLGDKLKPGRRVPIFRSIRTGYHPWHLTEGEARTLDHCVRAVIQVWDQFRSGPEADYWTAPDLYPLVTAGGEIRQAPAPRPATPMPQAAKLDEKRLEKLRSAKLRPRKVLQVDHFYGGAPIGEAHERKMLFRVAMAIDGETAFAYPPEVAAPQDSTGDLLARVVLKAMETGRVRPGEIQVRRAEFEVTLEGLGRALGIPVRVAESLPALDFAKGQLMRMMDPAGMGPP